MRLAHRAVRGYKIAPETFDKLRKIDAYLAENYRIAFGNRIMRQITIYLPVYVACGGDELDALDDILAKKVLRKLETQNLTYRAAELEALCAMFNELFGPERMKRCLRTVRRIARNT